MLVISSAEVDRALTFGGLVETLRAAFKAGAIQPVRHHHTVENPGGAGSVLLLMPAWTDFSKSASGWIGVKIVTVAPDNNTIGKPAVMGQYLLLDGVTGEPRAMIDGQRLTQWRTACASALASTYLSRPDSENMLMIGAGALSTFLVQAHAAVRPIRKVSLWNRTFAKAQENAHTLATLGFDARAVEDLDAAIGEADIISSATISRAPLVKGALLKPGAHVDLVGAFTPEMRESDDDAITRASVFVDTREGAMKEGGDIVIPLNTGVLQAKDVKADLYDLCRGKHAGRESKDEITLFKSVGAAIEDLAAGIAVFESPLLK